MKIKYTIILFIFNSIQSYAISNNFTDTTNSIKLQDIYCIIDSVFYESKGEDYIKNRGRINFALTIEVDSLGNSSNCTYYSKDIGFTKEFEMICISLKNRNVSYFQELFKEEEGFIEKHSFFIVFNSELFEFCL